ncbi:MAG TPA: hypothetical protein VK203_04645 [Nostocaceae cyanobacterium]|nr:hypothetical protein [Nostocaceae cyanobacterium]
MLEKLLLASILTFSFSLIADMGWSASNQKIAEASPENSQVLTITQNLHQISVSK